MAETGTPTTASRSSAQCRAHRAGNGEQRQERWVAGGQPPAQPVEPAGENSGAAARRRSWRPVEGNGQRHQRQATGRPKWAPVMACSTLTETHEGQSRQRQQDQAPVISFARSVSAGRSSPARSAFEPGPHRHRGDDERLARRLPADPAAWPCGIDPGSPDSYRESGGTGCGSNRTASAPACSENKPQNKRNTPEADPGFSRHDTEAPSPKTVDH